jgi:hypothetical protein
VTRYQQKHEKEAQQRTAWTLLLNNFIEVTTGVELLLLQAFESYSTQGSSSTLNARYAS